MTTAAEGEDFRPSDDEYDILNEDTERARVEGNRKHGYGGLNDSGDGDGNGRKQRPQQPDEDEELAAIKLTKQDIDFLFEIMTREARQDGSYHRCPGRPRY